MEPVMTWDDLKKKAKEEREPGPPRIWTGFGVPAEPTENPLEPRYVAAGEEFEDDEHRRPKWQHPWARAMKYMKHWGRKWFKDRAERTAAKNLDNLLDGKLITEEWVEQVLQWGLKPRSQGDFRPRWSYRGFLAVATDTEKFRDWEIRRANAQRDGRDASIDSTDLESIDARYGSG